MRHVRRFVLLLVIGVMAVGALSTTPASAAPSPTDAHYCEPDLTNPPPRLEGGSTVVYTQRLSCFTDILKQPPGFIAGLIYHARLWYKTSASAGIAEEVSGQQPVGLGELAAVTVNARSVGPCRSGFYYGTFDYTVAYKSGWPAVLTGAAQSPTVYVDCATGMTTQPPPGGPGAPMWGSTCYYVPSFGYPTSVPAGTPYAIMVEVGSRFTDPLRRTFYVGNGCTFTRLCTYRDAGNGSTIAALAGSMFADSRGIRYRVREDCLLIGL